MWSRVVLDFQVEYQISIGDLFSKMYLRKIQHERGYYIELFKNKLFMLDEMTQKYFILLLEYENPC